MAGVPANGGNAFRNFFVTCAGQISLVHPSGKPSVGAGPESGLMVEGGGGPLRICTAAGRAVKKAKENLDKFRKKVYNNIRFEV